MNLVPLAEIIVLGDQKAKALHVPQGYMILPDHVNIQRIGPKAARNHYVCREVGCTWTKEAVVRVARKHAEAHDRPSHIFEGRPRTEVLEEYAAKSRATSKRHRDRRREEEQSRQSSDKRQRMVGPAS